MALAVCLLFDRRSERAVRALWDRVEEQGVASLGSHTHEGMCRTCRTRCCASGTRRRWTDALAGLDGGEPVDLSFDGVGLFRRAVRGWSRG